MRKTYPAWCLLLTLACPGLAVAEPPPRPDASSSPRLKVEAPPAELKANPFYKKYVDADGYPILASATVDDYALKEAAFLVGRMLAHRPDVKRAMVAGGSRMFIIAHNEFTTDLPEFAHFKPKDYWDARARGTGGSQTDPYCTCGEENLLGYPGDPYSTECILIHEFAHNIHLRGLVNIDPTFDPRLKKAYQQAMAKGLWTGKYASVNHHEYFAEGVQSWFDNNREPDHDHNHVNTRKELIAYDSALAEICREVFGDTKLVYTKPATRLDGHMAGYDPSTAPTFRWPKRLDAVHAEIRRKARARSAAAEAVSKRALGWTAASTAACPPSAESTKHTLVVFENRRKRKVALYWIDPQGERKAYGTIPAGGEHRQPTYAGHAWLIVDDRGTALGHFIAETEPATAVIP